MTKFGIGNISHIDFTPINKKPGFAENYNSEFISAFIHFANPNIYTDGKYYWMTGAPLGEFWTTIQQEQPYKLQVAEDEYWICLKNKNPIKRTLMNIHQVVENGRHLENLITTQAEEIKNLKETVAKLTNNIDGVHNVVYQLIGGLFCQENQYEMIDNHLSILNGRRGKVVKCSIWPTTRQGDKNQERIEKIEKTLKTLLEFDTNCFNYEQLESKSDCSSVSSNGSERIKNSYDLCGNA